MTRCPGCYTAQEARTFVRQDDGAPVYLVGALLPFAIVAGVAVALHRLGRPGGSPR